MLRRIFALGSISFLICILTSADALATVPRTFVASTGSDANLCSIAAPCRGFARAMTQTSSGGEIIVLDSAGYGVVTITRSVSIIAPAGVYSGISVSSGHNGVTVNAPGAIVVLRGLSINGQGGDIGISLLAAARLRVENCVVSGMGSTGISHTADGGELIVIDTLVRDNAQAGISVQADANTLIDHTRVEHNAGDGIGIVATTALTVATIRNSVMAGNGQGGLAAFRAPGSGMTQVVVEDSIMSMNAGDGAFVGGVTSGAVRTTFRRNTLARNGFSGVSVYFGASGSSVVAYLIDNTFVDNPETAIKAYSLAVTVSSGNHFTLTSGLTFESVFGGDNITYGDNTGASNSNIAPSLDTKF
jgi:hypothetical protein